MKKLFQVVITDGEYKLIQYITAKNIDKVREYYNKDSELTHFDFQVEKITDISILHFDI